MNAGNVGKGFLAEALFVPQTTKVAGEALLNIHAWQ